MGLLIYFIAVSGLAAFVFFIRKPMLQYLSAAIYCLVQLSFNYLLFTEKDLFSGIFFRPDALSLIFISVLSITGITTIINSFVYFNHRQERSQRRSVYLASLFLLFG